MWKEKRIFIIKIIVGGDGSGSKFLTWVRLGNFFAALVGSGRVGSVTSVFGKVPLKNTKFSIFALWVK